MKSIYYSYLYILVLLFSQNISNRSYFCNNTSKSPGQGFLSHAFSGRSFSLSRPILPGMCWIGCFSLVWNIGLIMPKFSYLIWTTFLTSFCQITSVTWVIIKVSFFETWYYIALSTKIFWRVIFFLSFFFFFYFFVFPTVFRIEIGWLGLRLLSTKAWFWEINFVYSKNQSEAVT